MPYFLASEPDHPELRNIHTLLERGIDVVNNLIVVTNPRQPDNPIVLTNEHFMAFTGYSKDEVLGHNCRFLQRRPDGSLDDDQPGLTTLRNAISEGRHCRVVLRNYRKDGTPFWNELFVSPLHDSDGEIAYFVGVQNDVSQRENALREVARREHTMSSFFDSTAMPMGVVVAERSGLRHLVANKASRDVFGGAEDGEKLDQLRFPEALTRRLLAAFDDVDGQGGAAHFELHLPGHPALEHLSASVHRVPDEDGRQYSYIFSDESTRVAAQHESRLLQAAVENADEAITITGPELDEPGPRILYVNPAFERMTGYTAEETVGRNPRFLQGPATDPAVMRRLRNDLETTGRFRGETTNYRKDGTPFVMEWNIAPIRAEDGTVTQYVASQRDVTKRRSLEQQVLKAQAMEQERLAYDLHDGLGQLLTGLTMQCHSLQTRMRERGEASSEELEQLEQIKQLAQEATEQIRGMAHAMRPVEKESAGLMKALTRLADVTNDAQGVTCTFSFEEPVLFEDAEIAGHLYRIAQEAVTNALKHAGAEHILIGLSTQHRNGDSALALTVRDDGVGVPEAEDGDGMGMQTMRYRAKRIGGVLTIEREDGGGTTVTCMLPHTNRLTLASHPDEEAEAGA